VKSSSSFAFIRLIRGKSLLFLTGLPLFKAFYNGFVCVRDISESHRLSFLTNYRVFIAFLQLPQAGHSLPKVTGTVFLMKCRAARSG
jgi:hypothetical protein